MSVIIDVKVPDIGDFENVEVIEALVAPGDRIEQGSSLITIAAASHNILQRLES